MGVDQFKIRLLEQPLAWIILGNNGWLHKPMGIYLAPNRPLVVPSGECLPGVRSAHARCATFVPSILTLAPTLPYPGEAPKAHQNQPQTLPYRADNMRPEL